jgi:molybdenum cofactor guanylyltransferase
MKNITISILCGGKSSRMQSEKGLVYLGNKPFIEHILDSVLPISNSIQLITNTSDYDYLPFQKTRDIVISKGPLGGIYSALEHSKNELNMILSCDIPFITNTLLLELIQKHDTKKKASVLADSLRIHPLIGIYSKKVLPVLKEALNNNDLKLMHFLDKISHQVIPICDEKSNQLKNINSIADLLQLNTNLS